MTRRVQDITRRDLALLLKGLRETYSPWTCVAVHRLLEAVFSLAVREGILVTSPTDRLSLAAKPRQQNAKEIVRLDSEALTRLVTVNGMTERWACAIGLAALGGLRLGEIRGLRWADVDLEKKTISVARSLLPDGTSKAPKSAAGRRVVPLFPEFRRLFVAWRLRSGHTGPEDWVVCTAEGKPVSERNLRRVLEDAKRAAGLDDLEGRLSWHSLRHSQPEASG